MSRHLMRALALFAMFSLFLPASAVTAGVEISRVWCGVSKSLESRTKTKKLDPVELVLLADGSFSEGDRSIVCSVRVFDGKQANGLPGRRKGVKATFKGEILDGFDGSTIQVLKKKSRKTDEDGDATVEFELGDHDNFYAVIEGRLRKKKLTGTTVSCTAAPTAGSRVAAKPSMLEVEEGRHSLKTGATTTTFAGVGVKVSDEPPAEDYRLNMIAAMYLGASTPASTLTLPGSTLLQRHLVRSQADFIVTARGPGGEPEAGVEVMGNATLVSPQTSDPPPSETAVGETDIDGRFEWSFLDWLEVISGPEAVRAFVRFQFILARAISGEPLSEIEMRFVHQVLGAS